MDKQEANKLKRSISDISEDIIEYEKLINWIRCTVKTTIPNTQYHPTQSAMKRQKLSKD